jgi:uncharacterized protein
MKSFISGLLVLLTAAVGWAADQVPLFNATLTVGKEHRFVLVSSAGKTSSFLRIGESFEGYTVKAYDAKESALDLERDGKISRVTLVGGAAVADAPIMTPATLADAEDLMRKMNFDGLMKSTMEAQKKAMASVMQQTAGQTLARLNLNLTEEDKAAFTAMQNETMDEALRVIAGPEMRSAMARIYSEVFSKEELDGLAAFYGTPAGQALNSKQPDVQQKMMSVMMPLVIQGQQAGQQKMRTYVAELRAKYPPAAGGAATGGSPPAPATGAASPKP